MDMNLIHMKKLISEYNVIMIVQKLMLTFAKKVIMHR